MKKSLLTLALSICTLSLQARDLPPKISEIMELPRYHHSFWGLYVKNANTGEVLHDVNSDKMFLPASTTKMFSMSALLDAYGADYRFKTPLYAVGETVEGDFTGTLVLVGQGDMILGGRDLDDDSIEFVDRDHTIANAIPGAVLTKADPLKGIKSLALQVKQKGIKQITGEIQIDDNLFETTVRRDTVLSPAMLNENLIDISIHPTTDGKSAKITWRPMIEGFTVKNEVVTGSKQEVSVTSDTSGQTITVKGTISENQGPILRTFSVKDPKQFVRLALIQALKEQGIKVLIAKSNKVAQYPKEPIATIISAPLSEYVKLVLKVSHNLGANLAPLLLAVKNNQKTYDEGMILLGDYVINKLKVPASSFVFNDGAGGDENRVTPQSEVILLEHQKQNKAFVNGLPVLGVDGSLADWSRNTPAAGKVRAKTGTGILTNLSQNKLFSTTHTLAGYVEGKNGQTLEFMVGVNNVESPTIESIFPIAEDLAKIATEIFNES